MHVPDNISTVEDLVLGQDNDMLFINRNLNMKNWLQFLKSSTCLSNYSILQSDHKLPTQSDYNLPTQIDHKLLTQSDRKLLTQFRFK